MKLRGEPGAGRGRRMLKGGELLRPIEVGEQVDFPWFDAQKEARFLDQLQDDPFEPETLLYNRNFHLAVVELGFFLTELTKGHPELFHFTPERLAEEARQSQRDAHGALATSAPLAALFDQNVKKNYLALTPQKLKKRMDFESERNRLALEFVFFLSIATPQQRKWVGGGISKELDVYVQESTHPGIAACKSAARLMLLYPPKRQAYLSQLKPEHKKAFTTHVAELRRKTTGPEAKIDDKSEWAEAQLYQQVLAAQSGLITPEGEVKLEPPVRILSATPDLPGRTVL